MSAEADVTSNNAPAPEDGEQSQVAAKEPTYEEVQRAQYLDPEGGYADAKAGFEAEKKAVMGVPPLHVNTLPTKMYLDATVTPTVMKALQEVCEARPENPLEFIAYYLLKHNPEKAVSQEGAPIGYTHPSDPNGAKAE